MSRILGLDLGSNSIGWAVRDTKFEDENQIQSYGVKIFEEGIKLEKGIPSSKAAERNAFKRMRLGYFRKRLRKFRVLRLLMENEMCPISIEELDAWLRPRKKSLRKFPSSTTFLNWLSLEFIRKSEIEDLSIHELRARAVREGNLSKYELGRIFYGMTLHRGYKSSRKDEPHENETTKDKKSNNTEQGIVLSEIQKISDLLEGRTLGEYLFEEFRLPIEKIRGMHFSREQLVDEFDRILAKTDLDAKLIDELRKEIFFQRPLKSQKKNVGYCTYEKKKYRCPISHHLFEEYRMLAFINNIKYTKIVIGDRKDKKFPLTEAEKELITPLFHRKSKATFEFKDIQEKLVGKKEVKNYDFNFRFYVSVPGCPTTAQIISALGDEKWNKLKDYNRQSNQIIDKEAQKGEVSKEDVWNVLFFFEDKEKLKDWAIDKLDLDDKQATMFSKIKLADGYASLSKKALKKIIPYLQNGLIYSHATFVANLSEVIGRELFDENKDEIINDISNIIENRTIYSKLSYLANSIIETRIKEFQNSFIRLSELEVFDIKQEIYDSIQELDDSEDDLNLFGVEYKLILDDFKRNVEKNITTNSLKHLSNPKIETMVKDYLTSNYNINDEDLKKIYHPSAIESFGKPIDDVNGNLSLAEPKNEAVKNPVFNRAMYELRSLVNYLLKKDIINPDTRIHIEFGREFNSMNQRMAIEQYQKAREKENLKFRAEIIKLYKEEYNKDFLPTEDDIKKYRLWLEQERNCIYTGDPIPLYKLFDDDQVEIEHTLPRSRNLDNSLANNTLCYTYYNKHIKKNKIPFELPNYNSTKIINGKEYLPILPQIEKLFGSKIIELEKKQNFGKGKTYSTKAQHDDAIRRKAINKFDLDYFRKKYKSFIIEEIPEGFKPSQSTDISLINKYAAEYLKTLFDRVTVYQSAVLSEVKKLWNIEPKDRAEHSHHTVDAIALSFLSKKLYDEIAAYYREVDDKFKADMSRFVLHPPFPRFVPWINSLKDSLIVKHTNKDYTLKNTKRVLRTNGKIQYLPKYEKDSTGNKILDNQGHSQKIFSTDDAGEIINKKGKPQCEYEQDEKGNRIPIYKQGGGYRNALHEQTYYGAIIKDNEIVYVVRKFLNDESAFKTLKDFEKIVDKGVKEKIIGIVERRINDGMTFKDAVSEDIYMHEEKGIKVRKVRIKTDMKNPILLKEHLITNNLQSSEHKKHFYVQNEGNYSAWIYEYISKGKKVRDSYVLSYYDMAQLKKTSTKIIDFIKGNIGLEDIDLLFQLKKGDAVLLYELTPEEIQWANNKDLNKRLYLVSDIAGNNDKRIKFRLHSEARSDQKLVEDLKSALGDNYNKTLGTGMSKYDIDKKYSRLNMSKGNFNFLIEGKDFRINQDGSIDRL